DVESAIAWYEYAADLMSGSDPGLVRKVSDLKMKRTEREIAEHEEFLSSHQPDDEAYAKRLAELQTARKNRTELLISEARERVERNPTDLQLRFELGEYLVNAGK